MPEAPVRAIAVVQEQLSGVAYRIALPNGKVIIGHLARHLRKAPPAFAPQQRVTVELTPYDFSQARITGAVSASGGEARGWGLEG